MYVERERRQIDCRSLGKIVRKRGFTLVELLVVIAIIGILVALLLPAKPQGECLAPTTLSKS